MKKKIIKKILFIILGIYTIITLINQQKLLNTYSQNKQKLVSQIEQAKEEQDELNQTKENADSLEYIEEIAREKLGMYLPNERVYIDSET